MEKIIVTIWMLAGIYIMVLLAIMADLWSGVRKAKQNGIARSSYGFKRTVDKIARYYNVLFAVSIIDAMQMTSIWYLEVYYGYKIPLFPLLTMAVGVGICLIEAKSIHEKAEDKVRLENVGILAGNMYANKDNLTDVIKNVVDYMNTPETKTTTVTTTVTNPQPTQQPT